MYTAVPTNLPQSIPQGTPVSHNIPKVDWDSPMGISEKSLGLALGKVWDQLWDPKRLGIAMVFGS